MDIIYEAYVEGDCKVADCRYLKKYPIGISITKNWICSSAVDEVLHFDELRVSHDGISTVYIFKLSKDVLEFPGRIRVDKTKEHYLIIEILNLHKFVPKDQGE